MLINPIQFIIRVKTHRIVPEMNSCPSVKGIVRKLRLLLIGILLFLWAAPVYPAPAPVPLSRWVTLGSDAKGAVKDIIVSEVNKREGFSSPQEEKANLAVVESDKERDDAAYKSAEGAATREFVRTKKRRDDMTTQFQAVSTDLEEQQKNIKTLTAGIGNLDSQIARYNQDIAIQRDALKKWLQTEKQGEAVVAVIFTQGFKDNTHALEGLADQVSAPLMAQHMGTYIQSFTKVVGSTVNIDFIRAIEEGTAKWNNEEPLRIALEKNNKGTTYLRLKRYELYPFQTPSAARVKTPPTAKGIQASVVTSLKEMVDFLARNGYSPVGEDLDRADRIIKAAAQVNATEGVGIQEEVRSFQSRIGALQEKIAAAQVEKNTHAALLKSKEVQYQRALQDTTAVQTRQGEADRAFQAAQKTLHDIRRTRESVIVKTALAAARGSQTPAEVSAEAIIDKLAEVRNDAKMQHSSSVTEVTNFQVSGESSIQTVTEARITAVRLIAFINEGDSVRVKMAFRVKTVLEEVKEAPRREPSREAVAGESPKVTPKEPEEKKSGWMASFLNKLQDDSAKKSEPATEPQTVSPQPAKEPVKRNPKALGSAEAGGVLFEISQAKVSNNELSVYVDLTNLTEDAIRQVALFDENYRWTRSKLTDASGKQHEVVSVVFWNGSQRTSMRDAGSRGMAIEPRATQRVQLIFRNVPLKMKTIPSIKLHPFVYQRVVIWTWQELDLVFQNIGISQ
jgi:hypothetical protein